MNKSEVSAQFARVKGSVISTEQYNLLLATTYDLCDELAALREALCWIIDCASIGDAETIARVALEHKP